MTADLPIPEEGLEQRALSDPEIGIRSMHIEGGQMRVEFTTEPGLVHVMADALMRCLGDAPNYTTATVTVGEANALRYSLTIAREHGRTPQEDLLDSRTTITSLRAENRGLRYVEMAADSAVRAVGKGADVKQLVKGYLEATRILHVQLAERDATNVYLGERNAVLERGLQATVGALVLIRDEATCDALETGSIICTCDRPEREANYRAAIDTLSEHGEPIEVLHDNEIDPVRVDRWEHTNGK